MLHTARCANDHEQVRAQRGWGVEVAKVDQGEVVETRIYRQVLEIGESIVGGFRGSSGISWRCASGCDGAGGLGVSTFRYQGNGADGLVVVSTELSAWTSPSVSPIGVCGELGG